MQGNLTIGIYGDGQQEAIHRVVTGMLRYADEAGGITLRDFRLSFVPDDQDSPPLWKGKVDGIIVGIGRGQATSKAIADWVLSGGAPAVTVTADWLDPGVPAVVVDSDSLGELAAAHLTERRCASYLYFGMANSDGSNLRAAALRDALARRGVKLVEYNNRHLFNGCFEDQAAVEAETGLARMLRSMRKPIGVWGVNDFFANAAGIACAKLGLKVPEQVKLLGVEDLGIARTSQPRLSSIRTPREQVGYQAMRTLHRLILKQSGIRALTRIRASELIARESTTGTPHVAGNLEEVKDYIERHAGSGIKVDQLVEMVGISRRAFEEWFLRAVGRTPGQEILRVRLERAKHLLATTELSMSRIASMLGYANAPAFTKFFGNAMGISPREFRHEANAALRAESSANQRTNGARPATSRQH